jgi:YD repeat-containing protein
MTDPLHAVATWRYDADGNLTLAVDRDGRSRRMAYDADNREQSETWLNSGGGTVNTQTFAYDQDGNLTGASDASGTYTYTYDPGNRLSTVQEPFGLSLTYSYDGNGNATGVVDSTGGVTTSVYDADNQLLSRLYTGQGAAVRFDQTWTADNQLGTVTRYADLTTATPVGTTSYFYDPGQRLTDVRHTAGLVVLEDFAYGYNGANWLTSEVDNGGAPTSYLYDPIGQLTGVVGTGAATYSYDAAGNRNGPGYATGTGNELSGDGTFTYTYDAEGNRLTRRNGTDLTTYSYDTANHLTGVVRTVGGTLTAQATYVYDVFGNRIEADDFAGGVATVTRFGYDGGNVWAVRASCWPRSTAAGR